MGTNDNYLSTVADPRPLLSPQASAAGDQEETEGREKAIAAIEAAFEAAQRKPVHLTNPELQPVEIMPGGCVWGQQGAGEASREHLLQLGLCLVT